MGVLLKLSLWVGLLYGRDLWRSLSSALRHANVLCMDNAAAANKVLRNAINGIIRSTTAAFYPYIGVSVQRLRTQLNILCFRTEYISTKPLLRPPTLTPARPGRGHMAPTQYLNLGGIAFYGAFYLMYRSVVTFLSML